MKTLLLVTGILVCSVTAAQTERHVILISIDGLRPEMYRESRWAAPNLRWLVKGGTSANYMKSVFPAYTYPSHVAMLTGALPARSGIHHNIKDSSGQWNWYTSDIRVPTLWQVLKKNGMTSSAVEWPVSVSDDIAYNIPEIWSTRHPEDRITETRKYASPGLIEEIERNATGKLDSSNMSEEYFSLDENSSRMAAYIFKTYRPNLLAVHFALLDGMEHVYGREHDSVQLALALIDRCIGNLLETAARSGPGKNTTILVVGDHGFSDFNTVMRPNVLLKGLPLRFVAAGGSAFLYGDAGSIPVVRERIKALPEQLRKRFRIVERSGLAEAGVDSAALLALAARPGLVFSNSEKGELTSKVNGGHHGYDPDQKDMHTGFIAWGAGIRKGSTIKQLSVTDIAPLIAKLLGIPFDCPDGKLPEGILEN